MVSTGIPTESSNPNRSITASGSAPQQTSYKPFINKNKCYNDTTKRPYKIHKNAT